CADVYHVPGGNPLPCLPGCWDVPLRWIVALGWFVAMALVAAGSGWSRAAVGAAILAKVVLEGDGFGWTPTFARISPWIIQALLLVALPLIPLVVSRVEEPRVVLALLALGRWREAYARSGGWRTALIAVAVVSIERGARAAFALTPDRWPHRVTK